jgi:hypothetical protein
VWNKFSDTNLDSGSYFALHRTYPTKQKKVADDMDAEQMHDTETVAADVPLFETIGEGAEQVDKIENPEEKQKLVEEIESLCINCEQNGTTRLLLTKIPFFREVIIMSFACPHCGISPHPSHFQDSQMPRFKTLDKFNLVGRNIHSKSRRKKI